MARKLYASSRRAKQRNQSGSDMMSARQKKELAALEAMPDSAIDTSDIPEVADWSKAQVGQFYRPIKQSVTIRLDAAVIAWFKEAASQYQTEINKVLRSYIESVRGATQQITHEDEIGANIEAPTTAHYSLQTPATTPREHAIAFSTQAQHAIIRFIEMLEPIQMGYPASALSILAIRQEQDHQLLKANLLLGATPEVAARTFQTDHVIAAVIPLSDLGRKPTEMVRELSGGSITLPFGRFTLPMTDSFGHRAVFTPFEPEGLKHQRRLAGLHILGDPLEGLFDRALLDWEVRAAPTPYDGLDDLASDFRVGPLGRTASIDILASNVAEILFESAIADEVANITLLVAPSLEPSQASLGYRVFSQGKVVARNQAAGENITWSFLEGRHVGRTNIPVPPGALVQCFANYGSNAQHQYWIVDPKTAQNPRRAIYENFDRSQSNLESFLLQPSQGGNASRDFESAVAWWLWMIGFSPLHIGHNAKLSDAPDIIAIAPAGHVAVIECTTGLLKAANKLQHLISRSAALRRSLDASGYSFLRILPVMATSRTRSEVAADLADAEKLGVLVLTADNLTNAVKETLLLPNPDAMFADAEQHAELRRAQHKRLADDDRST
jgi:uncharacterized protein (DUF4415 family)